MGDPISIALLGATVLSTGASIYGGKRQRDEMSKAADQNASALQDAERRRGDQERTALERQTMGAHRAMQRRQQALAGGFQSTVATTPVGIPGGGMSYPRATLIGGSS